MLPYLSAELSFPVNFKTKIFKWQLAHFNTTVSTSNSAFGVAHCTARCNNTAQQKFVYKMKLGIFEDFFMLNPNLAFILGW